MVTSSLVVLRAGERLSHTEAARLAELAQGSTSHRIMIDMSRVLEATTAAFARLVLLRRELIQRGCDVRLAALRGQPARLVDVHRLEAVLPSIKEIPVEADVACPSSPSRRLSPPLRAEDADIWSVATAALV
jgi:ABC-type transporter Mla MlaB component